MMQGILKEGSFLPNEEMAKKATEVFAKLKNVKDFHLKSDKGNMISIDNEVTRLTCSSKPMGEYICFSNYLVSPNRTNNIIDKRIAPFYKSIAALLPLFRFSITLVSNVVFFTKIIEIAVN
jgi:hypothetical protein